MYTTNISSFSKLKLIAICMVSVILLTGIMYSCEEDNDAIVDGIWDRAIKAEKERMRQKE